MFRYEAQTLERLLLSLFALAGTGVSTFVPKQKNGVFCCGLLAAINWILQSCPEGVVCHCL